MSKKKMYTAYEIQQHKNKYGRETPWYCEVCNNGKNYAMRGKHQHLNTAKHKQNASRTNNTN